MKKNNAKHKILVLADLNKSTKSILQSSVSLAKMIDGEIEFFHVKKPTEVIQSDNQLSAIRSISKKHNATENSMSSITTQMTEEYGVNIKSQFTFGNVKDEITHQINEYQPDIIVVGKRRPKLLSFFGDQVTEHVLEQHDGPIMIIDHKNSLVPDIKLAIGMLSGSSDSLNTDMGKNLIKNTARPILSFKIAKDGEKINEPNQLFSKKTVNYVFEQSSNAINTISKYVAKNNVNLLCLSRENQNDNTIFRPNLSDIINKLNVSLFVSGSRKNALQQY